MIFRFIKIVILHVRGGGELGDNWLLKSSEAEKSFKDFTTGVEYLKGISYSNIIDSNKIAFYGVSHGALTGAVAMNMKQDLFRAAVLQNGNMDLINDLPLKGRTWAQRYGHLNNKDDFKCIKQYAPLLHIQQSKKLEDSYPITLIVASKKDEEIPFTNSLKYLAHRREKGGNKELQRLKPILLKVINSGGHNYRSATKVEYIETVFIKLRFLAEAMQLKVDKKYETIQIDNNIENEVIKGSLAGRTYFVTKKSI